MTISSIERLPPELLFQIFSYILPIPDPTEAVTIIAYQDYWLDRQDPKVQLLPFGKFNHHVARCLITYLEDFYRREKAMVEPVMVCLRDGKWTDKNGKSWGPWDWQTTLVEYHNKLDGEFYHMIQGLERTARGQG